MTQTGVNTAGTHSLAEQAHQVMETLIITLRLLPGTLLTEKDLAGITGIGRTPVREAIQRLASDGLLQILPRKGLMVTTLRRTDMVNILEARKVLERLMVVKACERATPDQSQALLVMAEHTGATGNDPNALLRLIVRIDELLAAACHNSFLVGARASMQSQCLRLWYMYRDETDLLEATRLHTALANMVGEGNDPNALLRLIVRIDELLAAACHNSFLVGARASMQSQCLRLWYMYRDETDLLEATRLHTALANMVGEGNGVGAIRVLDEIIARLENLVARLDVLS